MTTTDLTRPCRGPALGPALLILIVLGWTSAWGAFAQMEETPGPPAQRLAVTVGDSLFIDVDKGAERVAVSDPDILDAVAIRPQQIMVHGKHAGVTGLVVWDTAGARSRYRITVRIDLAPLRAQLRQLLPSEDVQASALHDAIVLSGSVSNESTANKVLEMARLFTKNVINLLRTPAATAKEEPQILLQVRFAEVDRTVGSELGANLISTGALHMPGAISTQQFGLPGLGNPAGLRGRIGAPARGAESQFSLSDLLNVFAFRPDLNLALTIKALQARGLLQILAEPNLITRNGREASFLAGGEFPYAVVQSSSGSGFPAVHVQFKEFGIRLKFTPELTRSGTILLKVQPEVSDLDFTNALTISGFVLPSIRTRRAATEIELRDGQSFAIAGLMDHRVVQQASKIPLLGDVPILGNFFKSRSLKKSNSELVVLVTPQIVKPLETKGASPLPEFDIPFLPERRSDQPHPGGDSDTAGRGSNPLETAPHPGTAELEMPAGKPEPQGVPNKPESARVDDPAQSKKEKDP